MVSTPNNCGISVKISHTPGGPVYQVEYVTDKNNDLWYNFSHQDGNPFTDVTRALWPQGGSSGGKCLTLWCGPGDDGRGCDWRNSPGDQFVNDCRTHGDLYAVIC
jgi:hypothetical protein